MRLSSSTRYDSGNAYTSAVNGYDNAYQPTGTSLTLPASEGKLAGTYSVGYTYTLDEQVKTQVYGALANLPSETVTTYYDQLSLPRWSGGGLGKGTYVADSSRSSFGDLLGLDLTNSYSDWLTWTYEQGTRRLLTERLERQSGTGADVALTYSHDDAGNVTSITDAPTQPGVSGDTQCFTYDGLRRLTTAWTPATGGCQQTPSVSALGGAAPYWTDYTYDTTGNRTATTAHAADGDTTASYTYPTAGTHGVNSVATTGRAGTSTSSFSYDASGNTTTRQLAGKPTQTLTWDTEGRLSSVTSGGSNLESDLYSANGDRIIRRAGTQVTAYLPGGQELTLDTTTGTLSGLRYYSFAGQTIAVRNGSGFGPVTSLIPDSQGTATAAIANATNTLTRRYADPFGAPRGTNPTSWVGDHGFLDKATDNAIGLTQVGARYLDITLGRFISVDPVMNLLDPQQWNAYAYANNNPTTWSDPTGRIVRRDGDSPRPNTATSTAGSTLRAAATGSANTPPTSFVDQGAKADSWIPHVRNDMSFWQKAQAFTVECLLPPWSSCSQHAAGYYSANAPAPTSEEEALEQLNTAAKIYMAPDLLAMTTFPLGGGTLGGARLFGSAARDGEGVATLAEAVNAGRAGADDVLNGARLRAQLTGQEISGGHAFGKHVVQGAEFPGITTRSQFAAHIEDVVSNGVMRPLSNGRSAYWQNGTVVIRNPNAVDGGTAFRPTSGYDYFLGLN